MEIHPHATVFAGLCGSGTRIGAGSMVGAGAVVRRGAVLGEGCWVAAGAEVREGCVVEGGGCVLQGGRVRWRGLGLKAGVGGGRVEDEEEEGVERDLKVAREARVAAGERHVQVLDRLVKGRKGGAGSGSGGGR